MIGQIKVLISHQKVAFRSYSTLQALSCRYNNKDLVSNRLCNWHQALKEAHLTISEDDTSAPFTNKINQNIKVTIS